MGILGASWAHLGLALGAFWSVRRRLGGVLGPSLGILGGSWKGFGESWRLSEAILEALLKDLESFGSSWAVLARLGCVWGVLWARLGASEGVLEASWGHLGMS